MSVVLISSFSVDSYTSKDVLSRPLPLFPIEVEVPEVFEKIFQIKVSNFYSSYEPKSFHCAMNANVVTFIDFAYLQIQVLLS